MLHRLATSDESQLLTETQERALTQIKYETPPRLQLRRPCDTPHPELC